MTILLGVHGKKLVLRMCYKIAILLIIGRFSCFRYDIGWKSPVSTLWNFSLIRACFCYTIFENFINSCLNASFANTREKCTRPGNAQPVINLNYVSRRTLFNAKAVFDSNLGRKLNLQMLTWWQDSRKPAGWKEKFLTP